MTDLLERILRPIVEGQVRSYLNDHPEVVEEWPGKIVGGVSKRIVHDLLSADNRRRLMAALVEVSTAGPSEASVEDYAAAAPAGVEACDCPGRFPEGASA